MNACDEELFLVFAFDAKSTARTRITFAHAVNLLADAAHRASENRVSAERRKLKSEELIVLSLLGSFLSSRIDNKGALTIAPFSIVLPQNVRAVI
jgi:hypothetical protein